MAERQQTGRKKSLQDLLLQVPAKIVGDVVDDLPISAVTADSRKAGPGMIFVAVQGAHNDGHQYIQQVLEQGCEVVVVQRPLATFRPRVTILVADSRQALGRLLRAFYDDPAGELVMVGITGTNGKTTTSYLLEHIVAVHGGRPGVLGTVSYRFDNRSLPAALTTPGPEQLYPLLRTMADSGITHVIMEISSHALSQQRVAGISYDVALFTNLSHDHLDYHQDMESYYQAKKLLFTHYLKPTGRAVIVQGAGQGAPWGKRLADELVAGGKDQQPPLEVWRCGGEKAAVSVDSCRFDLHAVQGTCHVPKGSFSFSSTLLGRFNLENILAAAGVAAALEVAPDSIAQALASFAGVPGRLERVATQDGVMVLVDYAHTPDALAQVLTAIGELVHGRLLVVFGCGGDRDREKRPAMGRIAGRLADLVIVTSDNPRSEDPEEIARQVERGVRQTAMRRQRAELFLRQGLVGCYDIILGRREAIRTAVSHARPNDVILLCGKGHEEYQLIADRRIYLDDRMEAKLHLPLGRPRLNGKGTRWQ